MGQGVGSTHTFTGPTVSSRYGPGIPLPTPDRPNPDAHVSFPPTEINRIFSTSTSSAAFCPPTSSWSLRTACSVPHPRSEPGTSLYSDCPPGAGTSTSACSLASGVCVLLPRGRMDGGNQPVLTECWGGLLHSKQELLSARGALGYGESCCSVIAVVKEESCGWREGQLGR